jgi:PP-loop superfamily ATP-utilizing enzyme
VLDNTVPASGFWRSHQKHEYITLKELRSVRYAVESFMPELANHIVQLHEDNQAVVAILMSGTSRSPELMRELRKLFDICSLRNITLRPQYIRSHLNVLAVRLSRY